MFQFLINVKLTVQDVVYNLQIIKWRNPTLGIIYEINVLNDKNITKITGFRGDNILDVMCLSLDFILQLHELCIR